MRDRDRAMLRAELGAGAADVAQIVAELRERTERVRQGGGAPREETWP